MEEANVSKKGIFFVINKRKSPQSMTYIPFMMQMYTKEIQGVYYRID